MPGFHSKIPAPPKEEPPSMTKGMRQGFILAVALAIYGYWRRDIPLLFFCVSFLTFIIRPLVEKHCGSFGKPLSNGLKGFSMALLFGAIIMMFF